MRFMKPPSLVDFLSGVLASLTIVDGEKGGRNSSGNRVRLITETAGVRPDLGDL